MPGRSGLLAVIIIGLIIYYSGALNWLWERVQKLDAGCYAILNEIGTTMGSPVCRGVTQGIEMLGHLGETAGEVIEHYRQQIFSGGDYAINNLAQEVQSKVQALSSTSEGLQLMMQSGPHFSAGVTVQEKFQRAIDSFAIGQNYLSSGTGLQALPWLQQSAAQPQGYGLLSQLTLGNIYATGNYGVTPDTLKAQLYLQQAQNSLKELSASNTPQAQQMLQTLPVSPGELQMQIDAALRQMKSGH